MRTHAAELVALGPDIILAHSSAALAPLLQVTRTVPIVFTIVADPFGAWVPLLRLRATHYHTVAQERCCASQQKLRADVAVGSWLCENSSGRATRRNISEQLHR